MHVRNKSHNSPVLAINKWECLSTFSPDLNKLGEEGWELVTVVREKVRDCPDHWQDKYYLKRKINAKANI